jgi:DNA primase
LDLRELQRTGRIGRIDVEMNTSNGKTSGMILIPSSLDSSETALVAACVETIERVGPCNAKLHIQKIEDVRISKRKYVIERAKELLAHMFEDDLPEVQEISEHIKESVRIGEVVNYKGSPAGPNIESYDSIIIVEGRADVIKMLKNGIKNVIAVEGTNVSNTVAELARRKEVTAFLDGDRGGDLILKELANMCEVDFVARAPRGKEVEELTKKEIFKALREKVPFDQMKIESGENGNGGMKRPMERMPERSERPAERMPERAERPVERSERQERPSRPSQRTAIDSRKMDKFKEALEGLTGTRAAVFMDAKMQIIGKVPSREVFNTLQEAENVDVIVIDGLVDQKLVDACSQKGVKYLVAMKSAGKLDVPENMKLVLIQSTAK